MTTWFTADTHFGHMRIIQLSKRPFASVEEMDEALIANWNALVKPGDDVWHLGDFNFRGPTLTPDYVKRLNGRIHLIRGNHDDGYAAKHRECFASFQDVKYLRLYGEKLYLSHYAHRVWRNSHHGAWHLYGHSHGCLPNYYRSMDVGVDACGYHPISFEAIGRYMLKQDPVHHHPEMVTDPVPDEGANPCAR